MGYQYVTLETIPAQSLVPEFVRQMSLDCGELIGRELRAPVRMIFINSTPIHLDILYRDLSTRYPEVNWNPVFRVIAQYGPHAVALDSSCFFVPDHYQNLCLIFGSNGRSYIFHELVHFLNSYPRGNQSSTPEINLAHYIINEYEAEYFGILWGLCYALEKPDSPFGHFIPVRNMPPRVIGERGTYKKMACFLAQRRLANEGCFDEAFAKLNHDALNSLRIARYENDLNHCLEDYDTLLPRVREQLLHLESTLTEWNFLINNNTFSNNIAAITTRIGEILSRELELQHIDLRELNERFLQRFWSHR